MQQDAEEFYAALSQCIRSSSRDVGGDYDSVLGVDLEERLTCQETDAETPLTRIETTNKIVCNIQGSSIYPYIRISTTSLCRRNCESQTSDLRANA